MTTNLIVLILQMALQYGPAAASAIQQMLAKTTPPTQAEWDALFLLLSKPGESYFQPKV